MVGVAKKERQEDISFNHYTVNSRQEILCEPRATYILWDVDGVYHIYIITIITDEKMTSHTPEITGQNGKISKNDKSQMSGKSLGRIGSFFTVL
jgi:hypothetical protein